MKPASWLTASLVALLVVLHTHPVWHHFHQHMKQFFRAFHQAPAIERRIPADGVYLLPQTIAFTVRLLPQPLPAAR